jgi:hypothetical protein
MTSDYSRVERWWTPSVVVATGIVAVLSFAIRRVGVDEIEKGKLGEVKG